MSEAKKQMTCIVCPVGCRLTVSDTGGEIQVSGNSCARGASYGRQEFTAPVRTVTTSVRVDGGTRPVVSVKTANPIDKNKIPDVLSALRLLRATPPCVMGEVALPDVAGTGVDIVFTTSLPKKQ